MQRPRTVLNRLGQVGDLDIRAAGQVSDRPGQFEHPVVAPRREVQPAHGRPEEGLAGLVRPAEAVRLGRPHLPVRQDRQVLKSPPLPLAGRSHPGANRCQGFPPAAAGQLFILDPGHLHVEVHPVQQRPRDAPAVAGDHRCRIGALLQVLLHLHRPVPRVVGQVVGVRPHDPPRLVPVGIIPVLLPLCQEHRQASHRVHVRRVVVAVGHLPLALQVPDLVVGVPLLGEPCASPAHPGMGQPVQRVIGKVLVTAQPHTNFHRQDAKDRGFVFPQRTRGHFPP